MPGITLKLENIKAINNELNRKGSLASDLRAPFKRFSMYYMGVVDRTFKQRGRPPGSWKPLSEYTLALRSWKEMRGRGSSVSIMPLIVSGDLRRSFTADIQRQGMKYGTNWIYAEKHQKGGTSRRPQVKIKPKRANVLHFVIDGKDYFAKSVTLPAKNFTIPARPIITWLPKDDAELEMLMEEHMRQE